VVTFYFKILHYGKSGTALLNEVTSLILTVEIFILTGLETLLFIGTFTLVTGNMQFIFSVY